jgi:hypothetical protein
MAKPTGSQPARSHDALVENPLVPMFSLPPQPVLVPQPLLPAASACCGAGVGAGADAALAGSHDAPASDGKPRVKERRARWTEDEIAKLEQVPP